MNGFVTIETRSSEPIEAGSRTLTLFSQSVQVKFPGLKGGFIYNHPVSLLATTEDGDEQIIPVPDVTRQVQLGLLAACLVVFLLAILLRRR